ncbi:MAG: 50S ribosomal protein L15 [Acidobacteria bacterium]|nr:50S ribosomal protein L15 [Acidobacteriota bacterium]MBI3657636.1 50S ribosomal protein L15 [Acidobacteriota bacterium]
MRVNTLGPKSGATHKRKRVGRGRGSGHGKTAGRGEKGQWSRSGTSMRPGFEGGQMPLHRRLPKRGFTNIFRKEYSIVNLDQLAAFSAGSAVNPLTLREAGVVRRAKLPIKVLANGDLKNPLIISAHKFSAAAKEKILKAGGQVQVLE